ncbi:TPR-like protein [Suillus lakei]|nr:TPR-like protein [Suillus lakei]
MHAYRGVLLGNLGVMLGTRFERRGNDEDLDRAIALEREALALCPVGHTDRSLSLNNLANRLSTRFSHRGNDGDLDEGIALHREALALRPVGHTDRSSSLNNLAVQLSTRFSHRGNDGDLDEGIALHREALALRPALNNLANQLSTRFSHRGNDGDLDEGIALHREALALCPVGHTGRSMSLNNLAVQLSTRFSHRGNDGDLDEGIALHMQALALRPSLNDLAVQLSTRFSHRGNDGDLDEALALRPVGHTDRSTSLNNLANRLSTRFSHRGNDGDLDEALALRPVGHTDRSTSLNNLAVQLSTRFSHRGNDGDLDEAIALHREALALWPVGHTDRSGSLNNLAVQLSTRFSHRGNDGDFDEAIALHREALALWPSLNNLANQLSTRFSHRGNDGDLDEAIALHREALALCPVGHTDRSGSLNNLAVQLSTRFSHRGNDGDLDEAIALDREALALWPSLNNLANQLSTRFSHRGNDGDLDEAIALDREALALHPSLNNLANQLSTRFSHRGNDGDFDEAIALHREALALRPVGHTNRSSSLNNLAVQLSTRFEHRGNDGDLDEGIALHREALALRPVGHTDRSGSLNNLAVQLSTRFEHRGNDGDLDEGIALHREALALRPACDLACEQVYVGFSRASQYSHGTELEAYATSMQFLDAFMSATASVSSRHSAMKEFPRTLAVDAASCALRSSLENHGDHAVALMKKFRDLSSLLDKPPASTPEGTAKVSVEAEAAHYRRLVEEWNRAVEEIREIEGFSRFLLPPLFSDLQDAARDGPIIVLIASESSCDAIIIPHKEPPTSIRLPTNLEKLRTLVVTFQEAVEKEADPKGSQSGLIKALRMLWDDVVRPVIEILNGFAKKGSRVWWCPNYRDRGMSLSQQYISSYTPSLTALMRARRNHDRSPSVSFAAIGQNLPAGHSLHFGCLLPPSPTVSFTKITSVDATKLRALRALRENTWLHFACHGTQDHQEPFKSAFLMRDQPLSLLDITPMDLSRHDFAFLSACDTAVGDFSSPDEVIHLAACVVGTLWKVNDATVQRLVEVFYKNLCVGGKMNHKRAARALHQAVQLLARDKDIPLDQRIVFMHIGV